MQKLTTTRAYLWAELCLLFIGVPLLLLREVVPGMPYWPKFVLLWMIAIGVLVWLLRQPGMDVKRLWHGHSVPSRRLHHRFAMLALCCLPLIALAVWLVPERLFWLPRERPAFLLWIAILYPVLSALPQELLYRSFFFRRYQALFGQGWAMVIASAACFGFVHVIFGNIVSPLLSALGGLIIARGYADDHSLKWATVEHGLYGCAVFIIGLGTFFILPR